MPTPEAKPGHQPTRGENSALAPAAPPPQEDLRLLFAATGPLFAPAIFLREVKAGGSRTAPGRFENQLFQHTDANLSYLYELGVLVKAVS
jgi:hypothetical protein